MKHSMFCLPKRRRYTVWLVLIILLSLTLFLKLKFLVFVGTENNDVFIQSKDTLETILIGIRDYLRTKQIPVNISRNEESERHEKIVKENSDTLREIAHLLIGSGQSKNVDHRYKENVTEKENYGRKITIKGWKPFYIDSKIQGAINDKSKEQEINSLIKRIEEWEPFYTVFSDEQSQDAILIHFELEPTVFRDLLVSVGEFEKHRKPVHLPPPKTLKVHRNATNLPSWKTFHKHITQYRLYSPDDPLYHQMIKDLQTLPFTDMYEPTRGTQQKLVFYLQNDLRVVFKPMRFPRTQEALPDHMFWRDYERHFAEIAAFHLDRALEFYRVPPVVGRHISVKRDIEAMDKKNDMVFFWSPAGNRCFYGECTYYCDTAHAVCGRPDKIEGSFMMYTPSKTDAVRARVRSPWRRKYDEVEKAVWQKEYNYCDKVKVTPPYNKGRNLLDVMDVTVFDFIAGNMDRHHHESFKEFGNDTAPVLYDNGRGFGKSKHDELTILAPIYQCCLIRYSTLKKLLAFHKGPSHLSDVMRTMLKPDLASPILLEPQLEALDRRLGMILKTVHKCIEKHGFNHVVKDDGL